MTITFSVVTLTFNSEKYLDETIQSVIYQRGDFYIDYIVIDNCSSDSTLAILKEYQRYVEKSLYKCNCLGVKFRYISEPDTGMYDALGKGIRMCNGDFFSYINSDDFYLPNAFSTVAEVFANEEISWLTGVPCLYNANGSIRTMDIPCIYKASYIRSGVYGKYLPYLQQESTFWRIKLCNELDVNVLKEFKYAGDYYLWYMFAEKHKLYTVNAQLSGFRLHSNNKSSDTEEYKKEFNAIAVDRLSVLDYPVILIFKILYKMFGNNVLKIFPGVINLH